MLAGPGGLPYAACHFAYINLMTDSILETVDDLAQLILRKDEERRLRAGHLWVYANEVDTKKTPLKTFSPGQQVLICEHSGKPVGIGYVNPHSLICARLVSRQWKRRINKKLIGQRLQAALDWREQTYSEHYYRWVFAEADGLPGLVLDRYGDVIVGQITTAGMEEHREMIEGVIAGVVKATTLYWRNSGSMRALEGLEEYDRTAFGELPEQLDIVESGLNYKVPSASGQKTGWFYDQATNRQLLAPYCKDARVLDLFSYAGGWGISAVSHGASEAVCVDASQPAIDQVAANAALNGVEEKITAIQSDAFEYLKTARENGEHFDIVVVDPPAFIKRAKDKRNGQEAYRRDQPNGDAGIKPRWNSCELFVFVPFEWSGATENYSECHQASRPARTNRIPVATGPGSPRAPGDSRNPLFEGCGCPGNSYPISCSDESRFTVFRQY